MIRKAGLSLIAATAMGLCTPAVAWGPEAHSVIGRVAIAKLSPQAGADAQWIISVGVPALNAEMPGGKCQIDPSDPFGAVPDYVTDHDVHTNLANWPDCWRVLTPTTAPWHFDDIPLADSPAAPLNAASQPWCASGCVSTALADNLNKLASAPKSPADAAMALAFVVHFVGDLHQPLHAENDNDQGGNQVKITTQAGVSATNLHSLWDSALVSDSLGFDLDAATTAIQNDDASAPAGWTTGADTVGGAIQASDTWVVDAHALAQPAYALLNIPAGAGPTGGVSVTAAYVQQEGQVVRGQIDRAAVRLAASLNAALTWSPSAPVAPPQTPTGGYLNLAPLGYSAPPRPNDPLTVELDLVQVRAARPAPTAIQWQEAVSDADAYNAEDIVRRFDDASGALLYEADRPLLVSMLRKVITDTGAYAGQAKLNNPRPRPYVEDPAIKPCNTNFLAGTEQQSYPSGHAMNGYVVALVLSEVFPDRRQAILARGARYGDNRVACGVHHPSDVAEGRLFGIAYFHKLSADATFQADLGCAKAEQAFASKKTPLPASCAAQRQTRLRALSTRKPPIPGTANLF